MAVELGDFPRFFEELHRRPPFPWQQRLAEEVCLRGWPEVIDLPTASGKTACLDIALFALAVAESAPRRIFYVVDRRVLVNDAFLRMERVSAALAKADGGVLREVAGRLREIAGGDAPPLDVYEMRGGVYRDQSWVRSPLQPTVITSTVDQVGSRLLFRGYGVAPYSWPIHAALVANDSLILLDEAHCSRAFAQTLQAVSRYRGPEWCQENLDRPFFFVEMTATPARTDAQRFRLDDPDLDHPVLRRRLFAAKPARLVQVKGKPDDSESLAKHLGALAGDLAQAPQAKRIGIIANRVATARAVERMLRESCPEDSVDLLIGRMRPLDRDDLAPGLKPLYSDAERVPDGPRRWVVSTQCLEVGADLDFDILVTECASIDAILQRFGRLDRTGALAGSARGAIVIPIHRKNPDPVYGDALGETWKWLENVSQSGEVNMGIASTDPAFPTVSELLRRTDPQQAESLRRLGPAAPHLLPSHLDALVQTSPTPHVEPDVSLFLHGPESGSPDVQVVWRADLPEDQPDLWPSVVALCPPLAAEAMPVRLWDLRRWMQNAGEETTVDADLEGMIEPPDERVRPRGRTRRALRWLGKDSLVIDSAQAIRPGDTVILPSAVGWSSFGHIPDSGLVKGAPRDWGDRASWEIRRRRQLRLHPELLKEWPELPELEMVRNEVKSAEPDEESLVDALKTYRRGLQGTNGNLAHYSWLLNVLATLPDKPGGLSLIPYPSADDQPPSGFLLRLKSARVVVSATLGRPDEDAGNDEISLEGAVTLDRHTDDVVAAARAVAAGLLPRFAASFERAAYFHDSGKADLRFQTLLRGGDRMAAEFAPVLLAKGDSPIGGSIRTRWRRSGLPDNFRHEFLSLLFAARQTDTFPDLDLVLHLIASHHGRCRPFATVVLDPDPDDAVWRDQVIPAAARIVQAAHRLDSGVAKRFWKLTRRFGWWGAAYLEAAFRLSDWCASEGAFVPEHADDRTTLSRD